MIKNFVKTAVRNLLKNKVTSFINILGLSMAIGCSAVVYAFINWQYDADSFHENSDRIFHINNIITRGGESQLWGFTPGPLGPALAADFPQIESVVRIDNRSGIFRVEEKAFNERIWFTDEGFMEMFSFPEKWGLHDALSDESKIIISDEISKKYFGNENPVGKSITIIFGDRKESFEIGAVLEKYPITASFRFGILANYNRLKAADPNMDFEDWGDFISATFVQLTSAEIIHSIENNLGKYITLQNASRQDWPSSNYQFEPLETLALNSYKVSSRIYRGDDPTGRIVMGILGAFLLALACFNYINIAMVSASKRLKEIGLRKAVGGSKTKIIFQFLIENMVLTLIVMLSGLALGYFFFVPGFNEMFNIDLPFTFTDPAFWVYFASIFLITGVGSGAYPAFYISSFRAVDIFRGKQKFGTKNLFTRSFLTLQFILALVLITGGITFTQNAEFQKGRDWGYNPQNLVSVQVPEGSAYTVLKNEIIQHPEIVAVAGSVFHFGRSATTSPVEIESEVYEFTRLDIGENYAETMELRLQDGRFFDSDIASDYDNAVIVNQLLVNQMKWQEPIGKTIIFDSTRYQVIGVVENFHYFSFWNQIQPTFMRFGKPEKYQYLTVKSNPGDMAKTNDFLEHTWKKLYPDLPYDAYYQDQMMDDYLITISNHGRLMRFVAFFAILLACMGLYGLVSLRVAAKMKDFSIKKVLGAQLKHLVQGVSQQFFWVLIIAITVGAPLGYYLVDTLLNAAYAYYMPMSTLQVYLAVTIMISIALATVSTIVYKLVVANPVENLRVE